MVNQRTDLKIYQIKITLSGVRPLIWRRFLVKGDISLGKLHNLLQYIMGWEDSHLHQFTIGGKRYGICDEDESEGLLDEREYRLIEVISGGRFEYLYDFGDDWEHTLEIESGGTREGKVRYPVCVDGARACPPEDSGGVYGYPLRDRDGIYGEKFQKRPLSLEFVKCSSRRNRPGRILTSNASSDRFAASAWTT